MASMSALQNPVSRGNVVELKDHLAFESATIFIFIKSSVASDQEFFDNFKKIAEGHPVEVKAILLKTGEEPIAKKYEITSTPMALIYDRRGRQTSKATETHEIVEAAMKAADVGRIDWAMPGSPEADEIKKRMNLDDPRKLPGIMRAMSLRPEAMMGMIQMARTMHFSPGKLDVRTKEMIATYVSSLNQCKFCLSSHAGFLAKQGQEGRDIDALWLKDPKKAPSLSPKERALLEYVKLLTEEPWKVQDSDVEKLRGVGWTDPEIYEATFDISLFNFFNRMANAYGLDYAPDGWADPKKR